MEMDMRHFEEWLRSKGMAMTTIVSYATHVRRAINRIGAVMPTNESLDFHAISLPTNQRGAFRAAWRHFVTFASEQGVSIANVSKGRLGRPTSMLGERIEDFAIEYLSRVIPSARLADLRWWCDVDLVSPADAVIWDPVDHVRYIVHRRPLDVLLTWGHPDGGPYGAVVPSEPRAKKFMNSAEIEDRAEAVRARARAGGVLSGADAGFIRRLPEPRREAWDPRTAPRPRVDPAAWKP